MQANWFIALPVDPGQWLAPLVRRAPHHLRLFHPADVHITVAFLGAAGEALARQAWDAVQGTEAAPMAVVLGGVEPMGNPRRPSALSVVLCAGHEPVMDLIGALRPRAWNAAGARPDDRPPLPHLTVARPSRRASAEERRQAIAWARAEPPVGAQVVLDRIALYSWAEDRRHRQFRIVVERRFALAPSRPASTQA